MTTQAGPAAGAVAEEDVLLVLEGDDPREAVRLFSRIGAVAVPGLFLLFLRDEGLGVATGAAVGIAAVLLGLLAVIQAQPTRLVVERSRLRLTKYRFGKVVETAYAWSDLEATSLSASTVGGTEPIVMRWRNARAIKVRVAFYRYGTYGAVYRVVVNRTSIDWEQELAAHRYAETLRRLMAQQAALA